MGMCWEQPAPDDGLNLCGAALLSAYSFGASTWPFLSLQSSFHTVGTDARILPVEFIGCHCTFWEWGDNEG